VNPAVRSLSGVLAFLIFITAVCAEPPAVGQKPGTADDAKEKRKAELQAILERPIGVKFYNAFLDEVVEEISSRHDISIIQQAPFALRRKPVSSDDRNLPLGEALQKMVEPLGLEVQNRDGVLAIVPHPTPATRLQDALTDRVDLKFDKIPLSTVLHEISRTYGIKIEQKYRDPEIGRTLITIDETWVPLGATLREHLRPVELFCTQRGGRLVISQRFQFSKEDEAAYAWFDRPITGTWKETPLAAVLREISETERIDIRVDEAAMPELDRQTPVSVKATNRPLADLLQTALDPCGFSVDVKQGRLLVRAWPGSPQPRDERIERILREPVRIDLEGVAVETALRMLANRHDLKIAVDVPEGPVALALRTGEMGGLPVGLTVRATLRRLLEPVRLTVEIREGALRVIPLPELE
jgi:hypothetical protein